MIKQRYAPKKRTEEVRKGRLQIALTDDELELIRMAAHGQDRTLCNFAVHATLSLARQCIKERRDASVSPLISK